MIRIGAKTRRAAWQLAKFCLVGGSGAVVNTALLYALHGWLGLALLLASPLAVEASILNNFCWNNRFTFERGKLELHRLAKFNLVSLGGMAITTGALALLTHRYGVHYLVANLIAIGVATAWNFILNVLWTWRADPALPSG